LRTQYALYKAEVASNCTARESNPQTPHRLIAQWVAAIATGPMRPFPVGLDVEKVSGPAESPYMDRSGLPASDIESR